MESNRPDVRALRRTKDQFCAGLSDDSRSARSSDPIPNLLHSSLSRQPVVNRIASDARPWDGRLVVGRSFAFGACTKTPRQRWHSRRTSAIDKTLSPSSACGRWSRALDQRLCGVPRVQACTRRTRDDSSTRGCRVIGRSHSVQAKRRVFQRADPHRPSASCNPCRPDARCPHDERRNHRSMAPRLDR